MGRRFRLEFLKSREDCNAILLHLDYWSLWLKTTGDAVWVYRALTTEPLATEWHNTVDTGDLSNIAKHGAANGFESAGCKDQSSSDEQ